MYLLLHKLKLKYNKLLFFIFLGEIFTHLMCHGEKTLAIRQMLQSSTSSQAQRHSTMHIYEIHTAGAIRASSVSTTPGTADSNSTASTIDGAAFNISVQYARTASTTITTAAIVASQSKQSSKYHTTTAQPQAFPDVENTTPETPFNTR